MHMAEGLTAHTVQWLKTIRHYQRSSTALYKPHPPSTSLNILQLVSKAPTIISPAARTVRLVPSNSPHRLRPDI